MKYWPAILFVTGIITSATAQPLKKVTLRTGDNNTYNREVFYVLKENDTVRQGHYQRYLRDFVEFSGWYKMGKKDSTWLHLGRDGSTVYSKRFYTNGERTGTWEFNDRKGNPSWKYDFAGRQATYIAPSADQSETTIHVNYYQGDKGDWIKDSTGTKLIPLYSPGEWIAFLGLNLHYPPEAINNNLQGKIWVTMTIDAKGNVIDLATEDDSMPALNQEAKRVFGLFPFEFIPAEKNGRPVAIKIKQSLSFRLENPPPQR